MNIDEIIDEIVEYIDINYSNFNEFDKIITKDDRSFDTSSDCECDCLCFAHMSNQSFHEIDIDM